MKSPRWNTACEAASRRSCDLTQLNLHYLSIFMLRVRAELNGRHSEWVLKEFCPDKDGKQTDRFKNCFTDTTLRV